ncbi:hypothetical protein B0T14DRAFT_243985 [Immersiella caudata]|uniref:Uncharacterized protein n=1 Tax=Immersiella caudata TaxID=314043 RepID=A0AA39WJ27_9PEZI|nr:hypothetical protein B0T14DRAFT_243985 [Immersiella caudata]
MPADAENICAQHRAARGDALHHSNRIPGVTARRQPPPESRIKPPNLSSPRERRRASPRCLNFARCPRPSHPPSIRHLIPDCPLHGHGPKLIHSPSPPPCRLQ